MQELAPLTDEEVVARVVAGDSAVYELLMRRHNQRLYRVARAVLRDDLEAEDIVQETFVRAYTHLARFEGRSSVATWLTRIAFHESLRRRRRRRAVRLVEEPVLDRAPHAPEMPDLDAIDRRETRSMLKQALDSLPTQLRAVVMLRLVQGLSTRETAECLRLSEANVKVCLHRGRRMMLEAVQRQGLRDLQDEFAFGAQRCDRVVDAVFERLDLRGQPSDKGVGADRR
jgi:RNA polymerase sigma-70 factor, ECF subfamily